MKINIGLSLNVEKLKEDVMGYFELENEQELKNYEMEYDEFQKWIIVREIDGLWNITFNIKDYVDVIEIK